MNADKKSCCVFGHRKITGKEELKVRLSAIFENLIINDNVDTFYREIVNEFLKTKIVKK